MRSAVNDSALSVPSLLFHGAILMARPAITYRTLAHAHGIRKEAVIKIVFEIEYGVAVNKSSGNGR